MRPDTGRGDFERVAPDIHVRESAQRMAARDALPHVSNSRAALVKGDLVNAERLAREALKIDSRSEGAHTLLAVVYDRQGDASRAGDHYRKAAELAPTRGGTLNNYGTWLCANGREAESLPWFERAVKTPGYATRAGALANAGRCADRANLDKRADAYLRLAIRLDPADPVALSTLAERAYRRGDGMQARAFSERRLTAAPADAHSLLLASQIEEMLGDRAAAARYVQRMRAEFPNASGSGTGKEGRR
ncbi:type IV pilus biogenesis/stability protein PilW [Lysobacter sp. A3-1-A15]|uniref:type IV pilus biogenesis/stability protein PilW n=1 Tax=Novilysobacter viscosus TaxID=3098602 RepID=UPI002ED80DAB